MILDLDNLTQEQRLFKERMKESVTSFYERCYEQIQSGMSEGVRGQLNLIADRNSCSSNALTFIEQIMFVADYCEANNVDQIKTGDYNIYKALKGQVPITCSRNRTIRDLPVFTVIRALISYIVWSVMSIVNSSNARVRQVAKTGDILFIESDIIKHGHSYNDRYYTGLWNCIPEDIKKKTFYFIQFLPIPKFHEFSLLCKESEQNIVYLNDFLKIKDYVFALREVNLAKENRTINIAYKGIKFNTLFGMLYRHRYERYNLYPFLYERAIHNMKDDAIRISCFVDWYENQSYDKALYYAFKQYYPTVPIHSYVGYIKDYKKEFYLIPSEYEVSKHLAPTEVYVCSNSVKSQFESYGFRGKIHVVPFYRSQKVYSRIQGDVVNKKGNYLLVLLGINMNETKTAISYVTELVKLLPSDLKIVIKPHPSCSNEVILSLLGEEKDNISIKNEDTYSLILSSLAVIGANSTTVYESMALGVPVFLLDGGIDNTTTQGLLWYYVPTPRELVDYLPIVRSANQSYLQELAESVRAYYFEPVSERGTNLLLGIA